MAAGALTGSRLTRAIAAVLAASYVATLADKRVAAYLALVPGKTLPYVWNVFTAAYVEQYVVNVRALEPAAWAGWAVC